MKRCGHLAGFAVIGTVQFRGDGSGEVLAHQRFVDNEPYRAARRGRLIVDKFASRRRFEGWGAWAQDRIRVRGPSWIRVLFMNPLALQHVMLISIVSLRAFNTFAGRQWFKVL